MCIYLLSFPEPERMCCVVVIGYTIWEQEKVFRKTQSLDDIQKKNDTKIDPRISTLKTMEALLALFQVLTLGLALTVAFLFRGACLGKRYWFLPYLTGTVLVGAAGTIYCIYDAVYFGLNGDNHFQLLIWGIMAAAHVYTFRAVLEMFRLRGNSSNNDSSQDGEAPDIFHLSERVMATGVPPVVTKLPSYDEAISTEPQKCPDYTETDLNPPTSPRTESRPTLVLPPGADDNSVVLFAPPAGPEPQHPSSSRFRALGYSNPSFIYPL